jgi:elongation factor 1-beta
MGEVIVVLRVMPKSMAGFDRIKRELELLHPQRLEEEPIAFGLKAIKFTTIIPDAEGQIDQLEDRIRAIKGVKDVQTVTVSRAL